MGIHICVGDPNECESPAFCEVCGVVARPTTPITVDSATETFLCTEHRLEFENSWKVTR